jgi:hypothetical protein
MNFTESVSNEGIRGSLNRAGNVIRNRVPKCKLNIQNYNCARKIERRVKTGMYSKNESEQPKIALD